MENLQKALLFVKTFVFEDESEDEEIFLSYSNLTRNYYCESVVPLYSENDFKSHFRLNRSTFQVLLSTFGNKLICGKGRPPINVEKQLLCVLWFLSNKESFRCVADRFDLSKSTLHGLLLKVCKALGEMQPSVICWPSIAAVKEEFREIDGFPNVIGAIGGIHIPIKEPQISPEKYLNSKGEHSIILQAVATPGLFFSQVFQPLEGAFDETRDFQSSEIFQMFGNPTFFPHNTHIIGDSAYPLHPNLLVPYKENRQLLAQQRTYNRKLSKSRKCVEQAFGQLKGRFKRLQFLDVERVDLLPLYVVAACVLHNMCVKEADFVEEATDESVSLEEYYVTDRSSIVAIKKRDEICEIL